MTSKVALALASALGVGERDMLLGCRRRAAAVMAPPPLESPPAPTSPHALALHEREYKAKRASRRRTGRGPGGPPRRARAGGCRPRAWRRSPPWSSSCPRAAASRSASLGSEDPSRAPGAALPASQSAVGSPSTSSASLTTQPSSPSTRTRIQGVCRGPPGVSAYRRQPPGIAIDQDHHARRLAPHVNGYGLAALPHAARAATRTVIGVGVIPLMRAVRKAPLESGAAPGLAAENGVHLGQPAPFANSLAASGELLGPGLPSETRGVGAPATASPSAQMSSRARKAATMSGDGLPSRLEPGPD